MKTLYGIIFLVIILLIKCTEDKFGTRDWPRLNTLPVTNIIRHAGVQFNAEITYRGDFEILHYGFVWNQARSPVLENCDKVVFSGNPVAETFSASVSSTLDYNLHNKVRSFVETKDYIVYGTEVEFTSIGSKAPQIFSFTPLMGYWGDTITLKGKDFSYKPLSNEVRFGTKEADVVYASDTLLRVTVPSVPNTTVVKMSVTILKLTAVSEESFTYHISK